MMYHSEVDHALKEYELQINTALSSTQVVDGFMVKETCNIQDTITWYVGVHKGLMDAYKVGTFSCCFVLRLIYDLY